MHLNKEYDYIMQIITEFGEMWIFLGQSLCLAHSWFTITLPRGKEKNLLVSFCIFFIGIIKVVYTDGPPTPASTICHLTLKSIRI